MHDVFSGLFSELFSGFLADILNMAFRAFDSSLLGMLNDTLKVEELFAGVVTTSAVKDVYSFIYATAVSLVLLKFLFKGFSIYILWRDGDADASPQEMLIGAIQGIVVMVGFPYLYDMMIDVATWFTDGIMSRLGLAAAGWNLGSNHGVAELDLLVLILLLIYAVVAFVLWVKMLKLGIELLVLRLGIPVACVGLVDSDGGVFKTYMQTVFRTLFTAVVQITLFSLSVRLLGGVPVSAISVLLAISAASAAFGVPALMQQILIPARGGGGVMNKIYMGSMAVKAGRMLVGK